MDKVLEKFGLKYDDLSSAERDTLHSWMQAIQQQNLTIEKVKEYLGSMKETVEIELTKVGHNSKQDLLLKARLRNYMLLDAFLSSPEKAQRALERALQGMIPSKGGEK